MNFPGGPGVKNLPAVLGDKGSIPEDPTCCRATRPTCHNYWGLCTQSLCCTTGEATAMRNLHTTTRQETLLPATREGAHRDKHHGGGEKKKQPAKTQLEKIPGFIEKRLKNTK